MYRQISSRVEQSQKKGDVAALEIGPVIRRLRETAGKKAVEIARTSGVDPRTLAAIEKGRIKNPSFKNLEAIARALNISLSELFMQSEALLVENIYQGSQKGEFAFEFPGQGFRFVSYLPLIQDLSIGKVVVNGKTTIPKNSLPLESRVFISMIFGRLDVFLGKQVYHLKEGSHFLLNGRLPHSFQNPLIKECAFLLVTVPSFLALSRK